MGYIAHHAVIVTASGYILNRDQLPQMPDIEGFRESLPGQFRELLIGPVQSVTNGYLHFIFLPDGQGRMETSDLGDTYREQFIKLFDFKYGDGSSPFDVAEIRYGGDEPDAARITRI